MGILLGGLVIFFAVHSISMINEPWRNNVAASLGEWPWKGLYALLSLVGLVLIVLGYAAARPGAAAVYVPLPWLRHLAMVLLLPVFPLLLATYFPGRIRQRVGHPMLLATLLWAAAHLLANGSSADLLLFGAFLVWAWLDLRSMGRRTQRSLPTAPPRKINDVFSVLAGLVIYALFVVWLHGVLIGVPLLTR